MKINKPSVATAYGYTREVAEDPWSILEMVAGYLKHLNEEPDDEHWGRQYKITVTVEEM